MAVETNKNQKDNLSESESDVYSASSTTSSGEDDSDSVDTSLIQENELELSDQYNASTSTRVAPVVPTIDNTHPDPIIVVTIVTIIKKMKVAELREQLKLRNLPTDGLKSLLLARVLQAVANTSLAPDTSVAARTLDLGMPVTNQVDPILCEV